jgi:hypothetical protein
MNKLKKRRKPPHLVIKPNAGVSVNRVKVNNNEALVEFHDGYSFTLRPVNTEHATFQQVPTMSALRSCPRSIQMLKIEAAIIEPSWLNHLDREVIPRNKR